MLSPQRRRDDAEKRRESQRNSAKTLRLCGENSFGIIFLFSCSVDALKQFSLCFCHRSIPKQQYQNKTDSRFRFSDNFRFLFRFSLVHEFNTNFPRACVPCNRHRRLSVPYKNPARSSLVRARRCRSILRRRTECALRRRSSAS